MRIFIFLSTFIGFTLSFFAHAQSFRSGHSFESTPIIGEVMITCNGPRGELGSNVFNCRDLRLAPVEMDYFVGPANIDADRVLLKATQANGKVISKESAYRNGMSKERFNLWIVSLLQTPLLDEGSNQVEYALSRNGVVVSRGQFVVPITRGATLTCPRGRLFSGNMSDCTSPAMACQQYFQQYNYCM